MTNETQETDLVQALVVYDEAGNGPKGVFGVGMRADGFLDDVKLLCAGASIDRAGLGKGLWLYAAGDSRVSGKGLNIPAMFLANALGHGQVVYGPVVVAAVSGTVHVSLTDGQEDQVASAMRETAALGPAEIYNTALTIMGSSPNFDQHVQELDAWLGARLGIEGFSGADYR